MEYYISASIVAYKNDREMLRESIDSFLNSSLSVKLYIIDNSPTDELKDITNDSRVTYFHNPSNPGFGAAHNIAIKECYEISKFHLVLNPDVSFAKGVIEKIVDFMNPDETIGNPIFM